MREIRQSGSEGGGTEINRFSLPLSGSTRSFRIVRPNFGSPWRIL